MNKFGKIFSCGLRPYLTHGTFQNAPSFFLAQRFQSQNNSSTMKVTILGAGGKVAKAAALMLKQSPHIDELCLYDHTSLEGFARDLNYIDTKCRVTSYIGNKDIQKALSRSNIILILVCCDRTENCQHSNLFDTNSKVVKELATYIAKFSPKSLIAIGAEPINNMVPMFSEIMKKHGHYNPCTIFGITTIDVVRTNKFVGDILGLDPECVVVPVVGGHTEKTIVPILSQATPCNELTNEELEDVTNSVRQADDNLLRIRSEGGYLSYAFATARFALSLVKASRGQNDIVECAYVKSAVHPQLKYMATPVLLGPGGVAKNLGLPEMTDYETCLLENAIPILGEDIKRGEFVGGRAMVVVDGQLQDKAICDPCDPNPKAPRCPPNHCDVQSMFENSSKNECKN